MISSKGGQYFIRQFLVREIIDVGKMSKDRSRNPQMKRQNLRKGVTE
jgi:hypothetical protein